MEVIAPLLGFVTIIGAVAAGVIAVRRFSPSPRTLDTAAQQLIEDLQGQVAEIELVKQRLAELEERVDFAERVLARPREGRSEESR
jgi:hypothetical protein